MQLDLPCLHSLYCNSLSAALDGFLRFALRKKKQFVFKSYLFHYSSHLNTVDLPLRVINVLINSVHPVHLQ